jgi:hypothetical protein
MNTPIAGKKVLFLSHDASRTGAQILLLNLVRWLKINSDISFQIMLRNRGVLERESRGLARVWNIKTGMAA